MPLTVPSDLRSPWGAVRGSFDSENCGPPMRSRVPSTPGTPRCRPSSLLRSLALGLTLLGGGQYATATATATRSDPDVLTRADTLFRAGRLDSTLVLVDPVLERALADDDTILIARARIARASTLALTRRSSEAVAESRAALELARAQNAGALGRLALRWLAFATLGEGRTAEAITLYRALEELSVEAGDLLHEAYAHFGFAYVALQGNDLATAVDRYTRTVALFARTGEAGMELDARIGRARALRGLGRIAEMRAEYEEVMRRAEATGALRPLSAAINNLGSYEFEAGDPSRAVELWQRAVELERTQPDGARSLMSSTNLLLARMELGDFDTARREAEALLAFCDASGRTREAIVLRLRIASIDAALGHLEHAAAVARELFERPGLDIGLRAEMLQELGQILNRASGPDAEARVLQAGLDEFGTGLSAVWQVILGLRLAEVLIDAGRTTESKNAVERVRSYAAGQMQAGSQMQIEWITARLFLASGEPDSAEAALVRGLRHWETLRTLPRDPQWRERRGALGQSLHHELARLWLRETPPVPRSTRVRQSFELLAGYKARTLSERIRGPRRDDSPQMTNMDLQQLQNDVIEKDELLLDLHVDESGVLLFAVTRDTCEVFELRPRTALRELGQLYVELIGDPDPLRSPITRAKSTERLARELFDPVADHVRHARRVVLVPDGITHLLPLEHLLEEGLGFAPSDDRVVSRVPSVAVFMELRARRDEDPTRGLLAVEGSDEASLAGSRAEVRDLLRRFRNAKVAVLDPRGAPADSMLAQARSRSVLHVAAHGEAFDQRPWSSRLYLGAGPASTVVLEALEISDRRGAPPLTVLSSCTSAGGRVLRGEGVLGFGSAFLAAGSQTVVASLWPVDDAVTASLMREFYRELGTGADVATALAHSQQRIRAHATTSAPAYWAGFVALGDGDLRVAGLEPRAGILGSRARVASTFTLASVVTVLILAAWWRRRAISREKSRRRA